MAKIHPFESKGTLCVSRGFRRIKRNTPCVKRKHWINGLLAGLGMATIVHRERKRQPECPLSFHRERCFEWTSWKRASADRAAAQRFDEFRQLLWKAAKFNLLRSMVTDVPLNRARSTKRKSRTKSRDGKKKRQEWIRDERFFTIFQDSRHRWFTVDQIFFFSYLIALDEVRRCFSTVSGLRALRFDRSKKRNIDWRINGPWSRKYYYIIWESQLRGFIRANSEFHGSNAGQGSSRVCSRICKFVHAKYVLSQTAWNWNFL